jgi:two-component system sensor kinase FixL
LSVDANSKPGKSELLGEAQFHAVVDTLVDGLVVIDELGKILVFNPACERLFGYRADEVVGANVSVLMPSPYREEHDRYLRSYLTTGKAKIIGIGREVVGQRKDGSTFPMDLSVGEVKTGPRPRFVGIIRDITKRKQAEQALREQETRYRSIVETAPDGIVIIDEKGIIQSFSSAAERLFGYRAEEVIGANVSVLMPSPYREQHDGYIARYLGTGEKRIIGIGRIVTGMRRDGSTFPMELAVGEFRIDGQRFFTGFVRDITERQQSERRLVEIQDQLRHMSRVTDMAEMASAIAHELNQPLTAIVNYVEACRRLMEKGDLPIPERIQGYMEKAVGQAARAGDIIRHLREFLKKGEASRTPMSINPVVEEASALALIGAAENGIRVFMELNENLPQVMVDKIQIQQVVLNLVRNSVEALCHSTKRELRIRTIQDQGMILVSVEDTGPGLPDAVSSRLFQPFVTTKPHGMGIGLSICRSIIEAHGGRLWATTASEVGTTFSFTLPVYAMMNDESAN